MQNTDKILTSSDKQIIEEAYHSIEKITKSNSIIGMILRIGYSKPPSAISSKKKPEYI
jgi:hypothetical protein